MGINNVNISASPHSGGEGILDYADRYATELHEVLEDEYRALTHQDEPSIQSLVAKKKALLDSLHNVEPQLHEIFNTFDTNKDVESLQKKIRLCSELNKRNRYVVLTAIDQNRKSLALLRSILKLDQSSVYSKTGELNTDNSTRYLGNA
jgi:flagellar biosynthesis/type III secretory pathway chaperone